jgi:thiol:disulfide interchange protein DsbC
MASKWWSVGLLVLVGALAQTLAPAQQPEAPDPRADISAKVPGSKPDDFRASPIPGMFEYTKGTDIAYVTADGKYAINGDLYDIASDKNLTDAHRRELRSRILAAVPESQMLIFGPKDPKYTITVFTDVDCAFCRKLHSQIGEYNRLGIRVRYMLYPRTGPNSTSWTKAEQVWCSADRNDALTRAKLGEDLKTKPCTDNPVQHTWQVGQDFALHGTPAIVMADGDMIEGYLPPDLMLKHLQDEAKAAAKETVATR